jgi:hypothetical protein
MRSIILIEIESARTRYYDELFKKNPELLSPKKMDNCQSGSPIKFRVEEVQYYPEVDEPVIETVPLQHTVIEEKVETYDLKAANPVSFSSLISLRQKLLDIFFSWFMSGDFQDTERLEQSSVS